MDLEIRSELYLSASFCG